MTLCRSVNLSPSCQLRNSPSFSSFTRKFTEIRIIHYRDAEISGSPYKLRPYSKIANLCTNDSVRLRNHPDNGKLQHARVPLSGRIIVSLVGSNETMLQNERGRHSMENKVTSSSRIWPLHLLHNTLHVQERLKTAMVITAKTAPMAQLHCF